MREYFSVELLEIKVNELIYIPLLDDDVIFSLNYHTTNNFIVWKKF